MLPSYIIGIVLFHNHPLGAILDLIVFGLNEIPTLVGHFVTSPRDREKRD